jgi:hypothetical protein
MLRPRTKYAVEMPATEAANRVIGTHRNQRFGFAIQQLAAEAAFEAASKGIRGQAMRALRLLS